MAPYTKTLTCRAMRKVEAILQRRPPSSSKKLPPPWISELRDIAYHPRVGQPLIMICLSSVTTAGMAKGRERGSASALFNMMRNMRAIDAVGVRSAARHFSSAIATAF